MSSALQLFGYGTRWTDVNTDSYKGYYPNMTDYHMHNYFEISIIISGNVNVLFTDKKESSTQSKVVLLRPYTPHYIYCEPDMLYSRVNVNFSQTFVADYVPEWQELSQVFGQNGSVLKITQEQCERFVELADRITNETDLFRKRILLLYLISLLSESAAQNGDYSKMPHYISEALSYVSIHYREHIVASALCEKLGVGRTTFMTAFKKYTGSTLSDYVNRCRMKNAILCLQKGKTQQQAAEECGLTDACNLIRCFKKEFKMTPRKYMLALRAKEKEKK